MRRICCNLGLCCIGMFTTSIGAATSGIEAVSLQRGGARSEVDNEHSRSTSRFGRILRREVVAPLPANALAQTKQEAPTLAPTQDCFTWGKGLSGYYLSHVSGVTRAEFCQQQCQGAANCNYWAWRSDEQICRLKSQKGSEWTGTTAVYGPRTCQDPTPSPTATAPTAASPVAYVFGEDNSNSCPPGLQGIATEAECETAAIALGHTSSNGASSDSEKPGGCYIGNGGQANFNLDAGSAKPGRRLICKKACSPVGVDRYAPDRGGCCDTLAECTEGRPAEDDHYCASGSAGHGTSCWSYRIMCRVSCPAPASPSLTHCQTGDHVLCPGTTTNCAGNQCCPDGSACPSADDSFTGCAAKKGDCTKAPASPSLTHCQTGDHVLCPGTTTNCAGNQCCPDGSACPSADDSFTGCAAKKGDCTKARPQSPTADNVKLGFLFFQGSAEYRSAHVQIADQDFGQVSNGAVISGYVPRVPKSVQVKVGPEDKILENNNVPVGDEAGGRLPYQYIGFLIDRPGGAEVAVEKFPVDELLLNDENLKKACIVMINLLPDTTAENSVAFGLYNGDEFEGDLEVFDTPYKNQQTGIKYYYEGNEDLLKDGQSADNLRLAVKRTDGEWEDSAKLELKAGFMYVAIAHSGVNSPQLKLAFYNLGPIKMRQWQTMQKAALRAVKQSFGYREDTAQQENKLASVYEAEGQPTEWSIYAEGKCFAGGQHPRILPLRPCIPSIGTPFASKMKIETNWWGNTEGKIRFIQTFFKDRGCQEEVGEKFFELGKCKAVTKIKAESTCEDTVEIPSRDSFDSCVAKVMTSTDCGTSFQYAGSTKTCLCRKPGAECNEKQDSTFTRYRVDKQAAQYAPSWERLSPEGYCSNNGGAGRYQYWKTEQDGVASQHVAICKSLCVDYATKCVGITFGRRHCRVHVSSPDGLQPAPGSYFDRKNGGGDIDGVEACPRVHCFRYNQDPTAVPTVIMPTPAVPACCSGKKFYSPKNKDCYATKAKNYYKECPEEAVTAKSCPAWCGTSRHSVEYVCKRMKLCHPCSMCEAKCIGGFVCELNNAKTECDGMADQGCKWEDSTAPAGNAATTPAPTATAVATTPAPTANAATAQAEAAKKDEQDDIATDTKEDDKEDEERVGAQPLMAAPLANKSKEEQKDSAAATQGDAAAQERKLSKAEEEETSKSKSKEKEDSSVLKLGKAQVMAITVLFLVLACLALSSPPSKPRPAEPEEQPADLLAYQMLANEKEEEEAAEQVPTMELENDEPADDGFPGMPQAEPAGESANPELPAANPELAAAVPPPA